MINPPQLQHEYQFELTCIQTSIELLKVAKNCNKCPSHVQFIKISICDGLYVISDFILKVANLALDFFSIFLISFEKNEHFNGILKFRFLKLCVIAPAELLLAPIFGLARISITAFGILCPSMAFSSLLAIENLELKVCHYKLNLVKDVVVNEKAYYVISEIDPASAIRYLGEKRVSKLQKKVLQPVNDNLEQEVLASFQDFLLYVYQKHQLLIVQILECKSSSALPCKDCSLTIEAKFLLDYLSGSPDEAEPFINIFKNTSLNELNHIYRFIVLNLQHQIIKSPNLFDKEMILMKINKLDNLLSLRLHFGRVSHPYFSRNYHYPLFI